LLAASNELFSQLFVALYCTDIHRLTVTYFHHSYLCQLFWPPRCRARKCKHFAVLTSQVAGLALALSFS